MNAMMKMMMNKRYRGSARRTDMALGLVRDGGDDGDRRTDCIIANGIRQFASNLPETDWPQG